MATKNTKVKSRGAAVFHNTVSWDFSCFLWQSSLVGKPRTTISCCGRWRVFFLFSASLAIVAGCGSGDKLARFKVTGKVTFQGQPVEEGTITFEDPAAGQVNSSPLGSGGSYLLELPAGEFHVSISPPLVETKGTGDSPPDMVPKKVNNIPKKYWVQEKSRLSALVAKDKRKFDFELKP
jgi:hypothetical protein